MDETKILSVNADKICDIIQQEDAEQLLNFLLDEGEGVTCHRRVLLKALFRLVQKENGSKFHAKIGKTVGHAIWQSPKDQKIASLLIRSLHIVEDALTPPGSSGAKTPRKLLVAWAIEQGADDFRAECAKYLRTLQDLDFFEWAYLCDIDLTDEASDLYASFLAKRNGRMALKVMETYGLWEKAVSAEFPDFDSRNSDDSLTNFIPSLLDVPTLIRCLPLNEAVCFGDRRPPIRHGLIMYCGTLHSLQKTAFKLVKRWNFEPGTFPTISLAAEVKAARFCLRQPGFSTEKLFEIAESKPSFFVALARVLYEAHHYRSAVLAFEKALNEPQCQAALELLPRLVNSALDEMRSADVAIPSSDTEPQQSSTKSDGSDEYLSLEELSGREPLEESVRLVESVDELREVLQGFQSCEFVGVDAEWLPPLTAFWHCPAALMQIAPDSPFNSASPDVYLIDLHTMGKTTNEADELVAEFLAKERPIKIGLALHNEDWTRLKIRSGAYKRLVGCVDLQRIILDIPECRAIAFNASRGPPEETSADAERRIGISLSEIVERVLGRPLDKTCQMVNWEMRPMSSSRLRYAATDALAVCAVVKALFSKLTNVNSIHDLLHAYPALQTTYRNPAPSGNPRKTLKTKRRKGRSANGQNEDKDAELKSTAAAESVTILKEKWAEKKAEWQLESWKFAVPHTLKRLCKQLRGCGIDCFLADVDANSRNLIEAVQENGRVLIVKESPQRHGIFSTCPAYFLSSTDSNEQVEEILEVFGIRFDEFDICSRCAHCNGNVWKETGPTEVQDRVGHKTLANYEKFWICEGCSQVYWEGSMWQGARKHFASFLGNDSQNHRK